MKYLLPCSCGQRLPVELRQAGQQITCRCGASLEVPTLRGLAELKQIDERPPVAAWSRRQGVLFVAGIVWVAAALGCTVWFFLLAQNVAEVSPIVGTADKLIARIDDLSPADSFHLWRMFRDFPTEVLGGPDKIREAAATRRRWLWWTAAGAGVSGAGIAWLTWIVLGSRGKSSGKPTAARR